MLSGMTPSYTGCRSATSTAGCAGRVAAVPGRGGTAEETLCVRRILRRCVRRRVDTRGRGCECARHSRSRPNGRRSRGDRCRRSGPTMRALIFPGQGSQAVGMARGARRGLPAGAGRVRRGRRRPRPEPVAADVRGAGRGVDPHRQRPAGPDGGEPRGAARAGGRARPRSRARRRLRGRPFARRVLGARRRRQPHDRGCRPAAAHPRRGHAGGGGPGRRAPWRR